MIGKKAGEVPEGFKLHRQMNKIFKSRVEMADSGTDIDWGLAEAMAFGSLLLEGNHVRLTPIKPGGCPFLGAPGCKGGPPARPRF